jgi:hypothetical protein
MNMLQFFTCVFLLPYSFLHHYLSLSIMCSLLYILLSYLENLILPFYSPASLMNKFQFFLVICKHIYRKNSCKFANLLQESLSSWSPYGYGARAVYSQDNFSQLRLIPEHFMYVGLHGTGRNHWVTQHKLVEDTDGIASRPLYTVQSQSMLAILSEYVSATCNTNCNHKLRHANYN